MIPSQGKMISPVTLLKKRPLVAKGHISGRNSSSLFVFFSELKPV